MCLAGVLGAQEPSGNTYLDRLWISGQANFVSQGHPTFNSPYSGTNSLAAPGEIVTSRVLTLFTGIRLAKNTSFFFDLEETGGRGIGDALGVAGFTNLDVVRNPYLSHAPYVARIFFDQTIPLSREMTQVETGTFQLAHSVPVRRIDIRFGKFGTVDWFDLNSVGTDSHYQFLNWTADNNGAYDYAADTRGYTYGVVIEYNDRNWAARYGEMLMPKVANGIHLDADVARARAENIEVDLRPKFLKDRATVIRPLAYVNHADMGLYQEAIAQYLAGEVQTPDIIATREQGRIKYGFGLNAEQELTSALRAYIRLGWNNGKTESFAYTEVDQTASVGGDLRGESWHRKDDKLGLTFISNGISPEHREYLKLGGLGFLLGDGTLNYSRENILESYYTARIWKGISGSADIQRVWNPGYNHDRGPVLVGTVRLHLEGVLLHAGR